MYKVLCLLLMAGLSGKSQAKLLVSQEQALRLAFPSGIKVEKKTAYLGPKEIEQAQKLGHAKVESRVWTYYVGLSSSGIYGYAYFDRCIVRTMPATLMAALQADGRLRFIEVLSFNEPEDYLPPKKWFSLFEGKSLSGDLRMKAGIRNISGATLSVHAVTDFARRILAVHQILHPSVDRP